MRLVTQSVRGPAAVVIGSEVREMVSDGGVAISLSAAYPWLYRPPDAVIGVQSDVMRPSQ